jgi:hypothetical protein
MRRHKRGMEVFVLVTVSSGLFLLIVLCARDATFIPRNGYLRTSEGANLRAGFVSIASIAAVCAVIRREQRNSVIGLLALQILAYVWVFHIMPRY